MTYDDYKAVRDNLAALDKKTGAKGYAAFIVLCTKYPDKFGFKGAYEAIKVIKAYNKKYNKEVKERCQS